MLTLVDAGGAPAGTAAVTADTGGNWIALMPSARMTERSEWTDRTADSRLFTNLATDFGEADWDSDRNVRIGTFVADSAHRLEIDQLSAGNIQPDQLLADAQPNNLRTYFAPAWRDELFVDRPLSVGQVFEALAQASVRRDLASAAEPLGFAINRFNADLLAAASTLEGR
jgi:hypothetical protein